MEIGESKCRKIDSRSKWNEGQEIELIKGQQYKIYAKPKDQIWDDKGEPCDADGCIGNKLMKSGAFLKLKRHNNSMWLCLIGSFNKEKPYFEIGTEYICSPEKTGLLYFFANDVNMEYFYANNNGVIDINIERIA